MTVATQARQGMTAPEAVAGTRGMRVLQVIHGYPPHYMAGSEVYTRSLVRALQRHATVGVFTRVENPFEPAYTATDAMEDGVHVRRVNKPTRDYTLEDKYLDARMDDAFRAMMRDFQPDVVHIGHLGHLSTGIVAIARHEFKVPVVVTLHDFWLSCVRGQLVTAGATQCDGPSPEGCLACVGASYKHAVSLPGVTAYHEHMRAVLRDVDLFLAPSRTVEAYFLGQGVPREKVVHSPYGFERGGYAARAARQPGEPLRLGFLGRVIPVKGIGVLLRAFRQVSGHAELHVHGALQGQGEFLAALGGHDARIRFHGSYENDAVPGLLARLDAVVVPSLWRENSPLVIHEARLAGLPVMATDAGGMAELVRDGQDGYLFPMGDEAALARLLQDVVDDPARLGRLAVDGSAVRDIADDAAGCLAHYRALCAPQRITVVTNPGLCNMACPMCDTHSVHAPKGHADGLPVLPWELVERTLRDTARLGLREVIPSTMGEPLMYPHFDRLLALVQELGLTLNLTTNGSFPRGGVAHWAPRLLPVLSDMKVSLNGVDARINEAVMVGADTQRQVAHVEAFLRERDAHAARTGRRPTVTLQATYMERNVAHLPELLRWAIRVGIDRFKGHHLWVTWPELAQESLRRDAAAAARWNETVLRMRAIAAAERGPDGRAIRLDHVELLDLAAPEGSMEGTECPFLGREAWLEADGSFQVCCCPAPKRRAFGDFGNAHDTPFSQLWASPRYREFVGAWGEHPNCRECNMRRPKEGR